jgi:hypothetical protein
MQRGYVTVGLWQSTDPGQRSKPGCSGKLLTAGEESDYYIVMKTAVID